jgi:ATP-dependent metalloprotease FtsH
VKNINKSVLVGISALAIIILIVVGSVNIDLLNSIMLFAILIFIVFMVVRVVKNSKDDNNQASATAESNPVANSISQVRPMSTNISFDDVKGVDEVKDELYEIVDYLKKPQKYKKFDVKLPKGLLLVGPPGVGKTMVAKALATEADVPFFYQSGSAFAQLYVGSGSKKVQELFANAKRVAPAIIFIDEIDSVGKARGDNRNDEREATLNELLTQMDGFEDSSGVIVVGATNKIDMLDDALLRAGRFDKRVFLNLPSIEEREEIIKNYLAKKPHDVDTYKIAKMTVGFSSAALATLVNESALHAIKNDSVEVTDRDFEAVKDKVFIGKKSKLTLTDNEKKILSVYQSSKALSAYWFDIEFDKISLFSDGFEDIDSQIVSKSHLVSKIKVYLSGVAGVELVYGDRFSNAKDDIEKAKEIAIEMVERYGMGDKILPDSDSVDKILYSSLEEIKGYLSNMKDKIEHLSEVIIEKESIDYSEIKKCINEY